MEIVKRFLLLGVFCFLLTESYSQHSNTLYHLKGIVPQNYLMNPAHQPECGVHVGMPGLAPVDVRMGIPFSLNDVMYYDAELDSTVTYLHPNANKDIFMSRIRKNNYLHAEMSTGIASWGFRIEDMYFSFDIRQKGYFNANLPGDFLKFMLELNEDGEEFNFSNFDFSSRVYNEYSMGASKKFFNNLTLGIRGKLLFGIADISLKNSQINLHTDKDLWTVNTDFTLNANIPFADIPLNKDGNFALDSIEFEDDLAVADVIGPGLFSNFGMGMDLGIAYEPVERLNLSASIVDLGFISWKNNTYNISQNTSFEFDGVSIDSIGSEQFSEYLVDSLKNNFELLESRDVYHTFIPTKVYLGGEFMVNPAFGIGFLSMSEIYHKNIRQEFTVSTNFNPGKVLSFSLSYSFLNYSFNNLGFGLSSALGPLNMYFVLDNLPIMLAREVNNNIVVPHKTKNANIKVGLNLVFGCNREKRLMKDKPMVF